VTVRRRKFRWLLPVILLAALLLGFQLFNGRTAPAQRTLLQGISRGDFTREVTGSGQVIASRDRTISFRTGGSVAGVHVSEGQRVTDGALLAVLDTTGLERDLAANRARLQSAQADLDRTRAQEQMDRLEVGSQLANAENELASAGEAVQDARGKLEITERLFAAGAASRDELRAAQDSLARAERASAQANRLITQARTRNESFDQLMQANLANARSQITTLETTIAGLEEQLREAELRAPFAGVVTSIGFEPGSAVSPGQGAITLVDTQDLVISASFNENRASDLKAGQNAGVTPDADTSLRLPAVVRQVAATATRTNNVAQVEARLDFTAAAGRLVEAGAVRPGFSVTVRIEANRLEDVLLVPLEAISDEDGESFVFVVTPAEDGTGVTRRVALTVLDRNATVAAVQAPLLQAGDQLAVLNVGLLADGQSVTFGSGETGRP
jgi:RND family efflux transporter MFP subunit